MEGRNLMYLFILDDGVLVVLMVPLVMDVIVFARCFETSAV